MAIKPGTPTKAFEQRIVYRLAISADDTPPGHAKSKWVGCTYHNGAQIHGSNPALHGKHPPIVISVKDQDEIVWVGTQPFEIRLKLSAGETGPTEAPFYRTGPWRASLGNDGTWRVASGPAMPHPLLLSSTEYKFSAAVLGDDGKPLPDCDPLDPHIILEP